ncbi:MAG TPA: DsbA family oxidoreductase [Chitinophagaceae bacterium]|nr:DsbA family oxidoreductase [Chitinophagaceae bacterium]
MNDTNNTMLVEVWSDVMCPFCYIGKRKFEVALAASGHSGNVRLVWKSFQLDPSIQASDNKDYMGFLQRKKGFSEAQTKGMLEQVSGMARGEGLDFRFEKAVVANSFDAHRLSQLAKQEGVQDAVEEALFRAHFTEGKDISDRETLNAIGTACGLDAAAIETMLQSNAFTESVAQDIDEASQIGVGGVPFFVFNRKYAISGAQDTKVFSNTIDKAYTEWQKENTATGLQVIDGSVCKPGGECE